jgi:hypothetical protein
VCYGERSNYLLTDYGISCVLAGAPAVPAPSFYVLHCAPETAATGSISKASDIYQVGMTLFRLANGVALLEQRRNAVGDAEFNRLKARGEMPHPADYAEFLDARIKRVIAKATAADPAARYRSALEMRRALERIPIEGYWDVDASGRYVGTLGQNRYSYQIDVRGQAHNLIAFRENSRSGKKRRVVAHCHANLSKTELAHARRKFMLAVVKGST